MIRYKKRETPYPTPTADDVLLMDEIIEWTTVSKQRVKVIERLIRTYFDDSCRVCSHCGSQIKFAHKRLVKWWQNYEPPLDTLKLSELRELYPDIKATSKVEFIEKIKKQK